MSYISLGEAAKGFGISKATLSKAIKAGKMSFVERMESGAYKLDPAEVARFAATVAKTPAVTTLQPPAETPETGLNAALQAALDARLDALNLLLTEKDKRIADLERDRDEWRDQARLALPAPQQPRGGLFAWLGGKRAANG